MLNETETALDDTQRLTHSAKEHKSSLPDPMLSTPSLHSVLYLPHLTDCNLREESSGLVSGDRASTPSTKEREFKGCLSHIVISKPSWAT